VLTKIVKELRIRRSQVRVLPGAPQNQSLTETDRKEKSGGRSFSRSCDWLCETVNGRFQVTGRQGSVALRHLKIMMAEQFFDGVKVNSGHY